MAYSAKDVLAREKILQVLLVAPPKSGKTGVSVLSLPGPVFIFNTDGPGALDFCAQEGADFEAEDISGHPSYARGAAYLRANKAKFRSIVFDNVTFFVESLYKEVRAAVGRDDPRAIYPEITRQVVETVREILAFKKHTVIIGQTDPGDTNVAAAFGHLVAVSGKAKILLPAMMQDLLWLETSVNDAGIAKREFLLAPAGNWTKGARSVQGIPRMKADFTEFLRLANSNSLPKKVPVAAKTATVAKPAATVMKPMNGVAKPGTWKPNPAQPRAAR